MSGAEEWEDMMPHRIEVFKTTVNDEGKTITNQETKRTYRCLIDDTATVRRDATGTEVAVSRTAYCDAVPVDAEAPLDVDPEEEHIRMLAPWNEERKVQSVDRHYWIDGSLHNFTVRFT
jgi:hypothetical protein